MWKVLRITKEGTRRESEHNNRAHAYRHVEKLANGETKVNPIFLRLEDSEGCKYYIFNSRSLQEYFVDDMESQPKVERRSGLPQPTTLDELKGCPLDQFFQSKLRKGKTQL